MSIDLKRDLSDDELMDILQKQAKQRVDFMEDYKGRLEGKAASTLVKGQMA